MIASLEKSDTQHKNTPSRYAGSRYILSECKRPNIAFKFFYFWIVVVSLVGIQAIFPLYNYFLREIVTGFMIFLIFLTIIRRPPLTALWILVFAIVIYTIFILSRSDLYSLSIRIKLFIRLTMFLMPLFAVPSFVRSLCDLKKLMLFVFFLGALISLSAPIQLVTGTIPWLYTDVNWALEHGRAGFARYLSIYGDPNIGAITGALLPLTLIITRKLKYKKRLNQIIVEILTWITSLLIVAYSLSFSGMLLFILSSMLILIIEHKFRFRQIIIIGFLVLLALLILPSMSDRLFGVIEFFSGPNQLQDSNITSDSSHIVSDLYYRLVLHTERNDTLLKVIFGSTYNIVVPSLDFNPNAILAHNIYKELYLAGGLVGLGLFLAIIVLTLNRAWNLYKYKSLFPFEFVGTIYVAGLTFLILSLVMFGFPIYHYNGLGIIYWTSVAVIHTAYSYYLVPKYHTIIHG